ncbi:MAG: citrate synthase [Acidobacteriota bacterium]
MTTTEQTIHHGLEGIVAARTRLSRVDGQAGELTIAGFRLDDLAPHATFEEALFLLWNDRLPTTRELDSLRANLATHRQLPSSVTSLLVELAKEERPIMDALGAGIAALPSTGDDADAIRLVATIPSILGTYTQAMRGDDLADPPSNLGHAAALLHQLTGDTPSAAATRALDTYLVTVADHGFNASTFTMRVIVSTGASFVAAGAGALGALSGPLHGGAPGPALDLVREIATPDRAEPVLRERLARGERLMGFGHRVYRVRDPRADVLGDAASRLYQTDGDQDLYHLARHVEDVALRLLREHKPDRRIATNVEYYTALLLNGLDVPSSLFTPIFAAARMAGWTAHAREQRAEGRLIRPRAAYAGAERRTWLPLEDR